MSNKLAYIAYQVIDTTKTDDDGKKIAYWNRIGAAFLNKDDSLNVVLNAYPRDGRFQLRVPKAKTDDSALAALVNSLQVPGDDDIPF